MDKYDVINYVLENDGIIARLRHEPANREQCSQLGRIHTFLNWHETPRSVLYEKCEWHSGSGKDISRKGFSNVFLETRGKSCSKNYALRKQNGSPIFLKNPNTPSSSFLKQRNQLICSVWRTGERRCVHNRSGSPTLAQPGTRAGL